MSIAVYGENSDVPLVFLFGGLFLATVVIAVSPARRSSHAGQTFGKQLLGIRSVSETGETLSSRRLLVRELPLKNLLFGLPSVLLLGLSALVNYLWPLWDSRSRAVHDHLCATRVVSGEVSGS